MADIFTDSANWLADVFSQHISRTVTYRRGNVSTVFPATICAEALDEETAEPVRIGIQRKDFIFKTSHLFATNFAEPKDGDEITTTIQGVPTVWQVAPRPGQKAFRFCDTAHVSVRVHCQQVQ